MAEKNYKILIVDDDKFLLNMYAIKFKKSGIEIFTAGNGMEALSKLRGSLNPNAVILDIVMPGMDGLELLEHIRKENLAKDSTVIILTNQGQSADIDRAKKIGIDGYIVKAATVPSEVVDEVIKIVEEKNKKKS